jgi:Secretory lipase.
MRWWPRTYLGFAKSTYGYHPYLHADSEATTVLDSVRAARAAASSVGANLSGKVMFTGYSQGGHASMAAQRAAERDYGTEFNVVAGAHLAGPYNLSGSLRVPDAIAGVQFFVPYLVTSWQKVYGTVYTDVKTAFKTPYSDYIESLLPNPTLNYTTLVTTGKLPGGPGVTPNQARDLVFQPEFLAAAQAGGSNPLFVAAQKNDLLGWNPKARVLLCGGAGDPTVPPAIHQRAMKADFDSRGLTMWPRWMSMPWFRPRMDQAAKRPPTPHRRPLPRITAITTAPTSRRSVTPRRAQCLMPSNKRLALWA